MEFTARRATIAVVVLIVLSLIGTALGQHQSVHPYLAVALGIGAFITGEK